MRLAELFSHNNPLAYERVVKATYKKAFQKGRNSEQWGIIQGNDFILIDSKGEKHGIYPLTHFVKNSFQDLTLMDLQKLHQQKTA